LEVEPPTYTLRLLSVGVNRLAVMAVIHALRPELGLSGAKALLAPPPPQCLKSDVAHVDLEDVRRRFRDVGAVVEFVDNLYGRIR
jgi:ribosomal protein L7/L12